MKLLVPQRIFAYEMENVLRLFHPGEHIEVADTGSPGEDDTVTASVDDSNGVTQLRARVRLGAFDRERASVLPPDSPADEAEWALARLLFELLAEQTGIRPPWGTLTGVRPVRLCRAMASTGLNEQAVRQTLAQRSLVRDDKIDLALAIARRQEPLLAAAGTDTFSLYISIPFCPSRCLYCSFISHDIRGAAALVPDYLERLHEELRYTGALADRLGLRLRTVYIGGGTPTILSPRQLRELMEAVRNSFDLTHLREYTVEAGRPDTITAEKLTVMCEMGAGRVSVNPQTMNDRILAAIGRAHTAEDVRAAVTLTREAGVSAINMDLIAGLPGETADSFAATLNAVIALRPENITLHTLTVKRSSRLRERPDAFSGAPDAGKLLGLGQAALDAAGYHPYYLYRQKGTVQNLENTGWSHPSYEGLYNVLIMEELQTILAVGAGAVTKLLTPGGELKRVYNYKYPQEYLRGFAEMLRRKDEAGRILAGESIPLPR